jgi:hypothetical protein
VAEPNLPTSDMPQSINYFCPDRDKQNSVFHYRRLFSTSAKRRVDELEGGVDGVYYYNAVRKSITVLSIAARLVFFETASVDMASIEQSKALA